MEQIMKTVSKRYSPKWDGFTYSLVIGVFLLTCGLIIAIPGWITLLCCLPIFFIVVLAMSSYWYEISGNELIVHDFMKVMSFPIDKITVISPTKSCLAAPAPSLFHRIEIKFSDRSILRRAMPMVAGNGLIISPSDRNGFIRHLQSINPRIEYRDQPCKNK